MDIRRRYPTALFIRDAEVDSLVEEARKLLKAPTKKDAIKRSLQETIKREGQKRPFGDRVARAKALAPEMGPSNPDFDMKKFSDWLSGEED